MPSDNPVPLSQKVSYPTRLRWGQALDIYRSKKQKKSDRPNWAPGSVDTFIDFQMNRAFDGSQKKASDIISSDTHAQTIYAPNSKGVYMPFAPNQKVITDLGLQTVPTRTNLISNNSMVGAVVGGALPIGWLQTATTGLNTTVVGLGSSFGLPYIDLRISGTAAAASPHQLLFNPAIVASVGQVYSGSFWIEVIDNPGALLPPAFRTRFVETNGSSVQTSQNDTNYAYPGSGRYRFERAVTLAQADTVSVQFRAVFTITNGSTYDFTIRIWTPQFELGAFASPPILTTGAALTVNANRALITGLAEKLTLGVAGFIQFDFRGLEALSQFNMCFSDGSVANRFGLFSSSTNNFTQVLSIANTSNTTPLGQLSSIGLFTVAFAVKAGYLKMRVIGGPDIAAATNLGWPVLDRVGFGGLGYSSANASFQYTKKFAMDFLTANDDPAQKFDQMYSLAQKYAA